MMLRAVGKQDYTFVDTESKLEDMLKELSNVTELCVDTETTGLDPWQSELVGIGLCAQVGRGFFMYPPS